MRVMPDSSDSLDLARIVTLTPAPAIDRVYLVDRVWQGTVNRASRVESFLAGKGINVSRVLHAAGNDTIAVTALSERESSLATGPTPFRLVSVPSATRVNTIIVSADGTTTNVNEQAASLRQEDWDRLAAAAVDEVRDRHAHWLVVAGSFPTIDGTAEHPDPACLLDDARATGARICLDSGGGHLRDWMDAAHAIDLVKPNLDELSATVGRRLHTVGDVVDACRELMHRGVGAVLASLGGDGAIFVSPVGALWAMAPRVPVVNTTGAGDATLAGFLQTQSSHATFDSDLDGLAVAVQRAVSWGSRTVMEFSTTPADFELMEGVTVGEPPLHRPLDPAA